MDARARHRKPLPGVLYPSEPRRQSEDDDTLEPRKYPQPDDDPTSRALLHPTRTQQRAVRVTIVADGPVGASTSLTREHSGAACAPLTQARPRVSKMGTKKVATSGAKTTVLPEQTATKGRRVVRAVDMLSDAQRQSLRKELSQLARIRREAEASSASLRLG